MAKIGPPPGSMNGLRNGRSLQPKKLLKRLVSGDLPKTMVAVQREARAYRRALENEVLATHGEVDTLRAHHIDSATAATVQAGICRWLLRNRINTMATGDIRSCSGDIVKAKERRDAAVKALQLDKEPEAPWQVLAAENAK